MSTLVVIQEADLRRLVAEETRRAMEGVVPLAPRPESTLGACTVLGLDPHALYARSTIAARWDCSADTVRRIPNEALPAVRWRGGQTRYRGADVLRYEGLSEIEINQGERPSNVVPILSRSVAEPGAEADRRRRPGRPPKAGQLPQI